jgi:hypothetical protein
MSARVQFDSCPKGVRYRNVGQARRAKDRNRARGIAIGCPEWLLPSEWFRHPDCGGWHLSRDITKHRPKHHRQIAA